MLRVSDIAVSAMKKMWGSIQESPCKDVKENLKELRKQLNDEVLDVSECLRDYANLVDAYYSNCPPFGSGDEEKDFQEFTEIIGHSVVIGNYRLLDRWAIDYPKSNPQRLAEPIAQYSHKIDGVVKNQWQVLAQQYKWPSHAKAYCEYLCENLAQVKV
ncbi:MAG: hypothetical protein AAFY72_17810 [Cyanobacteria bacterium J06649_4]